MPNYQDVINIVEALMEKRDPYNHHGPRVSIMAMELARFVGLSPHEVTMTGYGGSLHDIGKLLVSDMILNLPRRLTSSEYAQIKLHPREGYAMLMPLSFDPIILDIVLHHHENYDGSGYPDGLGDNQISIYARIMRIVDVWDALTNRRPYRPQVEDGFAERQMRELSGKWFDPHLLDLFFEKVMRK